MTMHTSYLGCGFRKDSRKDAIKQAVDLLQPHLKEFDAIAFTGISGALVAPTLAFLLDKSLIAVRKDKIKEPRHSHLSAEGEDCQHYLIVDDFSSTGATVRNIITTIESQKITGEPVAVFFWSRIYAGTAKLHTVKFLEPVGRPNLELPCWNTK